MAGLRYKFSEILELLENNYYGLRGDENQTIYLSNAFNSDYNGTDVFNNEAKGDYGICYFRQQTFLTVSGFSMTQMIPTRMSQFLFQPII